MGEDLARPDDFQREEGRRGGTDEGGGDTVASTRGGGAGGKGGRRVALRSGDVAGTQGEVAGKGRGVVGPRPSLRTRGVGCSSSMPGAPGPCAGRFCLFSSAMGSGAGQVEERQLPVQGAMSLLSPQALQPAWRWITKGPRCCRTCGPPGWDTACPQKRPPRQKQVVRWRDAQRVARKDLNSSGRMERWGEELDGGMGGRTGRV